MKEIEKMSAKRKIGWVMCFFLLMALTGGTSAYALFGGKITEFTADQILIDPGGTIVKKGKIYMTPQKMRMDGTPGGMRGQDISIIVLKNKKKQYMLNTKKKLYFEVPFDERKMMQGMKSMKKIDNEKILGTEKVGGFKCTKKQIQSTVEFMGVKNKSTHLIWVTKRLDLPIRTKMDDGSITELRNIKKGAPDDKHFQIPKDYKEAPNMMELMGMRFPEGKRKDTAGGRRKDAVPQSTSPASKGGVDCGEWARIICQELGCTGIGCLALGGDLHAQGLVMDQGSLKKLGFRFGQGPYKMAARRLSKGRYVISVQAMSRRDDHQEKEVILETRADAKYPVQKISAPPGKYAWNSAIVYDMREQLGIRPQYEAVGKSVDFMDIVVFDPGKMATFGFRGLKKRGSHLQMQYEGNNRWKVTRSMEQVGPILVYESARWSAEGKASVSLPSPPKAQPAPKPVVRTGQGAPPSVPPPQAPPETTKAPIPAQGLLFPNSDFEEGSLANWTATGNAFQYQPTKGDNPTARRRRQPAKHQGDFWIGTFERYSGAPAERPGATQGDPPTGTLTSVPFQITGEHISFLVGGGNRPSDAYVALVVDGREVHKASGGNSETMRRGTWEVSEFMGKEACILIRDMAPRGWGHINADDFRYQGTSQGKGHAVSPVTTQSEQRLPAPPSQSPLVPREAHEFDVWFPPPPPGWTSHPAQAASIPGAMRQVKKTYLRQHDNASMNMTVIAHLGVKDSGGEDGGAMAAQMIAKMGGSAVQAITHQGYSGILVIEDGSSSLNFRISSMTILMDFNKEDRKTIMDYVRELDLKSAQELFLR